MYLSDERICPVCMKHQFNSNDSKEQCPVCGWINDVSQNSSPNKKNGANKMTLNEALKEFRNKTFPKECADKEYYKDYIYGSIVGGAVGDALGYPIEFCDEDYIFSTYGGRGLDHYVLDKDGKARISDDTQMTLFTAAGVLIGDTRGSMRGIRGVPSGYISQVYVGWLRTQEEIFKDRTDEEFSSTNCWLLDVPELYSRRAPGNTCLSALRIHKDGLTDAYENCKSYAHDGYMAYRLNDSKGCGGIMRVAPLGLCYRMVAPEILDKDGAEIAAITHSHSLGYMPAAVLTHILHAIVYRKYGITLEEIVIDARDSIFQLFRDDKHIMELMDIIDLAIELSKNDKSDLENINRIGEGWVAEETLAIAIYCSLRHKDDFSAGIIAAVNHKGDSDSTGAITGNILGAWLGYEAIDDKWKKDLELKDVIEEIAEDLTYGCMMSEYGDYRDPAWITKYIHMHRWTGINQ